MSRKIRCGACGVWNGYDFFKPKKCSVCGHPINSKPLPKEEVERILSRFMDKFKGASS